MAAREAVDAARAAACDPNRPGAERGLAQELMVQRVAQLLDLEAQDPVRLAEQAAEAQMLEEAAAWRGRQEALVERRDKFRALLSDPATSPAQRALVELELAALPRVG
ncbi:MAG: hypothetical protein IPO09_09065 [Anaeromyxobacter sp.]|nr:hypothetical protein [Anaeromyxobacter sp.]